MIAFKHKGPSKRSQHFSTTNPSIFRPQFSSYGQTIATFERNISQHCWAQHAVHVWPPCRNVLRHVGYLKSN